jgi:hypothetical protein
MLALKAYEEIFSSDNTNMQAMRELFLGDGEVGACKQQHRCSAAQA